MGEKSGEREVSEGGRGGVVDLRLERLGEEEPEERIT